jgi:hypothetical protein
MKQILNQDTCSAVSRRVCAGQGTGVPCGLTVTACPAFLSLVSSENEQSELDTRNQYQPEERTSPPPPIFQNSMPGTTGFIIRSVLSRSQSAILAVQCQGESVQARGPECLNQYQPEERTSPPPPIFQNSMPGTVLPGVLNESPQL